MERWRALVVREKRKDENETRRKGLRNVKDRIFLEGSWGERDSPGETILINEIDFR